MSEQRQPTLEYDGPTVNPGVPDGTRIVEISLLPSGRSPVTAVTVTKAVRSVPLLVMNALLPLMTHESPSRRAVVRVAPASVPPPGSVSPKAPIASPDVSRGSQVSLSSCEPNRCSGIAPRETAASSVMATEESTRASSSMARHRAK